METIKVKYFSDDMEELCYVAGKSDWIDLSAAEEVTLHAGDFQLIPLGVAIALPEGYEAHLARWRISDDSGSVSAGVKWHAA